MPSATQIANQALLSLGADTIADIGQGTASARAIAAVWPAVIDEVLRAHPWRCATRRFSLPAEAVGPAYGYAFAYPLPTEPLCLRVIEVAGLGAEGWTVEGRQILTDQPAPLQGRYIARIGEDQFEAGLAAAVAAKLAERIAYRITQSPDVEAAARTRYKEMMREARGVSATEAAPEPAEMSSLEAARW